MRPHGTLATALLLASACAGGSAPVPAPPAPAPAADPVPRGVETITAGDFYARIAFLADDALRGRDTPSPGLEVAAAYVASEFRRIGLDPAGDDGTYLQRWPYATRSLDGQATRLSLGGAMNAAGPGLAWGRDLWAVPGGAPSAEGTTVMFAGPPDTAAVQPGSLAGRIAVVPLTPAGGDPTAGSAGALQAMRRAGAAGVVFVLDASVGPDAVQARTAGEGTLRGRGSPLPAFYVRRAPLDQLFTAGSAHLGGLLQRARTGSPVDVPALALRLDAPITEVEHRPPNAVAILRGSDPQLRGTYVVFSAHMDHVGVRPDAGGDSIFNGADDDASGTSAILELAEAYASLPAPPRRSLIFLAVSGEEKGLLGSRYYADNPTVPVDRIVANINIDMIGRNAPDSAVVIGQEYSSLGPLAVETTAAHPELGLNIGPDPWPEERFFFRSDHFNFARREVPALFFFTGTHEDYHRPSDEVDTIDTDKAARITRLIYHIGLAIAEDAERPQWTPDGLEEVRRLTRQGR